MLDSLEEVVIKTLLHRKSSGRGMVTSAVHTRAKGRNRHYQSP